MKTFSSASAGISLIELLLVISLVSVLAVGVSAFGVRFIRQNNIENKTNELVSLLRTAQLNTWAGKADTQWGVSTGGGQLVLFAGPNYAGRDSAWDVVFAVPSSLSVTTAEVVFEPVTGEVSTPTTWTLTSGGTQVRTVEVNALGVINVN